MSRFHEGIYDRALFDAGEVQRRLSAGQYTICPPRVGIAPLRLSAIIVEDTIPSGWSASPRATWFVISSVPAKEYRVRDRLEKQGWQTWLPECVVERKHKRYHGLINRSRGPLFPGYLFVRFDLNLAQWRMIEEVDGVERLLRNGIFPRALPIDDVERLQKLCEADGGALVIKAGMPRRQYLAGETVRVIGGPFEGFEAIVDSPDAKDRINILLDILGGTRVIAVPEALVEPA